MEPQAFTNEGFEQAIHQTEKPVVVVFEAPWSVACLMYRDRIVDAVELCGEDAIFGFVDIDVEKELTERFSIITIPTTLIFYKEQIAKQYMGIQEPQLLQQTVFELIGKQIPASETEPTET
ncbi:MAG: thioredoxin family protein [Patescibacteria group bacterium]